MGEGEKVKQAQAQAGLWGRDKREREARVGRG